MVKSYGAGQRLKATGLVHDDHVFLLLRVGEIRGLVGSAGPPLGRHSQVAAWPEWQRGC